MASLLSEIVSDIHLEVNGRYRMFTPAMVSEVSKDFASCIEIGARGENGWYFGFKIPAGLTVVPGDLVLLGIDRGSRPGFIYCNGVTIRNMDESAYEAQRQETIEENNRKHSEMLERNRPVWEARESYLSDAVKGRMNWLRDNSENFDRDGWGYELVIAELTDMLVDSNLEETDEIKASDAYSQCSGNQFSLAKALAREILDGEDITGTIAGLSPITGKVAY